MKKFDKAFELLIENEGKEFTDESYDGQRTKFGITQKFLDDHKYDMKVEFLNLDIAKDIYYQEFWVKLQCERITSLTIAASLFDFAVNLYHKRAIRCLQRSINSSNEGFNLKEDGIIGDKTIKALNQVQDIQNLSLLFALEKVKKYNYLNTKKYEDRIENLDNEIMTANEVGEYIHKRQNFMEGWINRSFKMIGRV